MQTRGLTAQLDDPSVSITMFAPVNAAFTDPVLEVSSTCSTISAMPCEFNSLTSSVHMSAKRSNGFIDPQK